MIKVVLNTHSPDAVASSNYLNALGASSQIVTQEFVNYDKYDVVLLMPYEKDVAEAIKAKKLNPNILVGVVDPREENLRRFLQYIDFLVIDSIEMQDFYSKYQLPMFLYYEYPNISNTRKTHREKEKIIISYHGNQLHIAGMYPNITTALGLLAKRYQIELWLLYNIEKLGKFDLVFPPGLEVRHHQWSIDAYRNVIANSDIGIVPNFMPIKNLQKAKKKSSVSVNYFNDSPEDYLLKFKMLSNPGRYIIFSKLGIPVVSDMFPSAIQFISHEVNGFLAYSSAGWFFALEKLITSHRLRQQMSDISFEQVMEKFDFSVQNERLLSFIQGLVERKDEVSASGGTDLLNIFESCEHDHLGKSYNFWKFIYNRKISNYINKLKGG